MVVEPLEKPNDVCRMWSGFSSEIETYNIIHGKNLQFLVACGAASHLRLKHIKGHINTAIGIVACGAASHLRLKRPDVACHKGNSGVACGAASHLRLKRGANTLLTCYMSTSHVE